MSRGVARTSTFLGDDDRHSFLGIIGELVKLGALEVFAFCLMPNHYHLLTRTPTGELARWMRHINGDYVRRFNVRHRRVGHLWQGRYKAILVEQGEYLRECSRYIHLNANRARITRPAERYRWSSYRNYVGGPAVVGWVQTGPVLAGFGRSRARYRAYVESGRGEKQISPFERATAGLVLGGEQFVTRMRSRLRGGQLNAEEPSAAKLLRLGSRDPAQVEAAVEQVFPQARPARLRRLKMYALRLHSGLRTSQIARRYERTQGAVTLAAQQLGVEATKTKALAAGLAAVAETLEDENQ